MQRTHALQGILVNLVNHEYQHDCWIGEMRQARGYSTPGTVPSQRARLVNGYWMLSSDTDGAG